MALSLAAVNLEASFKEQQIDLTSLCSIKVILSLFEEKKTPRLKPSRNLSWGFLQKGQ